MSFHVGQKVVCIDGSHGPGAKGEICPERGAIYTIRELYSKPTDGRLCMRLAEIVNTPRAYRDGVLECSFSARRFRPVAEKPASMDIIRSIVLDPSKPIPDDPREPKHVKTPEEVASIPGAIR